MTGLLRDFVLVVGLVAYAAGKRLRTGSWSTGVRARSGRVGIVERRATGPRVLVHGVSVGEVHALEPFVDALAPPRRRPTWS